VLVSFPADPEKLTNTTPLSYPLKMCFNPFKYYRRYVKTDGSAMSTDGDNALERELLAPETGNPDEHQIQPWKTTAFFEPTTIAGISTPLVGRDAELQRLVEQYYALIDNERPCLVTVVGDPGIGKSRLAYAFQQAIASLPDPVQVLTFRAYPQMIGQPYSLIRLLVNTLFQIQPGAPRLLVEDRLEHGITSLLGHASAYKAYFIGHLIGYDFSNKPALAAVIRDSHHVRARALSYLLQCLHILTAREPLVLMIDDLHYVDDSSLDMLADIVNQGYGTAIMILGLARQHLYERRSGWGATTASLRIDLGLLAEHDIRRLIGEILRKAAKLPPNLRKLIMTRATGNPFYVEELIKMLISDGVIVPGPETWQVRTGQLPRLRVPETLGDLLRTRLQTLPERIQTLLIHAAVVGRVFWSGAAATITEPPPPPSELVEILATLEREGLIQRQPTSRFRNELEYSFPHALLHEVAYQLAPATERRTQHRRIAEWLINHSSDYPEHDIGLIAEHYTRADARSTAAGWYLRAARQAQKTHAIETALSYYQNALDHFLETPDQMAERIAAYEGLGEVYMSTARFKEAAEAFEHVQTLGTAAADTSTEARALNQLSIICDSLAWARPARTHARDAIERAIIAGDEGEIALGLVRWGWAEQRLENPQYARELGERALVIFNRLGNRQNIARCQGMIGMAHEHLGDYERATTCLESALEANRELGNIREMIVHLNNLAHIANARGNWERAMILLRENLRLARDIGNRINEIYALSNLGTALIGLERYTEAETEMRLGLRLCEESRIAAFSDFYRDLALACLGQNRIDDALELAQQAVDIARQSESPREIGLAWRALALSIARLSEPQAAATCFAESARYCAEAGAAGEHARTLRAWAEYEQRYGSVERAHELQEEACTIFTRMGLQRELARTLGG
jgi:tetratricopeptide (TPR) repeat protein